VKLVALQKAATILRVLEDVLDASKFIIARKSVRRHTGTICIKRNVTLDSDSPGNAKQLLLLLLLLLLLPVVSEDFFVVVSQHLQQHLHRQRHPRHGLWNTLPEEVEMHWAVSLSSRIAGA
jgi:hypothetical protein